MSAVSYKALSLWATATEGVSSNEAEVSLKALFEENGPLCGIKVNVLITFLKIFEKLKKRGLGARFVTNLRLNKREELKSEANALMTLLQENNLWGGKWGIDTAECLLVFLQYKGQLKRAKVRVPKPKAFFSYGAHLLSLSFLLEKNAHARMRERIFRGLLTGAALEKINLSLSGVNIELSTVLGTIRMRLRPITRFPIASSRAVERIASVPETHVAMPQRVFAKKLEEPILRIDWDIGTAITVCVALLMALLFLDKETHEYGIYWWDLFLGGLMCGIIYFVGFPPIVLLAEKRRMRNG